MNISLQKTLKPSPEQSARLEALQTAFAEVCNRLAPIARQTRCWNRVALHHMTYRDLRARYPRLGSQMVCNAIYSVSRTCRLVYQAPESPFNVLRMGDRPLPLIRFAPHSPVYFDRHTLSLKEGHLSMYTLDGRMRFLLDLSPADEQQFHAGKLLEVVLSSQGGQFHLRFVFGAAHAPGAVSGAVRASVPDLRPDAPESSPVGEFPEYLLVLPEAPAIALGDLA